MTKNMKDKKALKSKNNQMGKGGMHKGGPRVVAKSPMKALKRVLTYLKP